MGRIVREYSKWKVLNDMRLFIVIFRNTETILGKAASVRNEEAYEVGVGNAVAVAVAVVVAVVVDNGVVDDDGHAAAVAAGRARAESL